MSHCCASLLFFFVDGVGLGPPDPLRNPLVAAQMPALRGMLGGIPSLSQRSMRGKNSIVLPLDATMGVQGLPQSGTGQAALLAGFNAPRRAKQHFGPFPPLSLKEIVEKKNIFRRVLDAGLTPCFANAYPHRFFEYFKKHKKRLSMTTLSCSLSGIPLREETELREGKAVSADVTNEAWRSMGYPDMPIITPHEAGRRLAMLAMDHHFTLFEYWKTDIAGHTQNMAEAMSVLGLFDAMLAGVLETLDPERTLLVVSSDHGNIEDLSIKTHTRNPVPLILHGTHRELVASQLTSRSRPTLAHVTPAIMNVLAGA